MAKTPTTTTATTTPKKKPAPTLSAQPVQPQINVSSGIPTAQSQQNLIGGFPADYVPPNQPNTNYPNYANVNREQFYTPSDQPTNKPRYYNGDEWAPASQGGETIVEWQDKLIQAGLLKPPYQRGAWDAPTLNAYQDLLTQANAEGLSADQIVQERVVAINRYGQTGNQRNLEPRVISLTNPGQIADLANEVATRVMGRRLDPSEANHFAEVYNQMERDYQQQQYQLQLQGQYNTIAGEVTQPKSLSDYGQTDIAQAIKEGHPQESSEQSTLNAADIFFSMLRNSPFS